MPDDASPQGSDLELDRFLPYRLSILSNTVSGAIARLYAERFKLTIPEWRVMAVLGMAAPLSANQVARKTRMDKVQVSRAVARLLKAGRIEREIDTEDRRRAKLQLSAPGRDIYRQIVPLARAAEAELLQSLSDAELNELDRLFRKLQQAADEIAGREPEGVSAPARRPVTWR